MIQGDGARSVPVDSAYFSCHLTRSASTGGCTDERRGATGSRLQVDKLFTHRSRGRRITAQHPASGARDEALAALGTRHFDVLVIGGGITGAGIARDAALRGLAVALVERDDFASGTSSRSSRLIHGGVRYLEHGHLRLVFESSQERRRLLRLAPHLVRPLEFTWPVYAGARVPRWKLLAGLTLYDVLALFRNVAPHRRLDAAAVLAREPYLRRDGLVGGARYFDAATNDIRLTLANAIGARAGGAVVVNHAMVHALVREGGRVIGARVQDMLTGRDIGIRARAIVNAAGPWGDEVRRLDAPAGAPALRGTKGVHIALPPGRLGNRGALTLLSPGDGRVFFILPGESRTIVGTTDTESAAAPDEVRASREDVSYLLRSASHFFPDACLGERDVIAAWAGIRPLVAAAFGHGPASASREHAVARGTPGVLSISGGKLTTYRTMATEVVDVVERDLGRRVRSAATATVPLPGGAIASLKTELAEADRLVGPPVGAHLVGAYGDAWRLVWELAGQDDALAQPVASELPYIRAELRYAVEREMACTLSDLLMRRTQVAFESRDHGLSAAADSATLVAPLLGWSTRDVSEKIAEYERDVERVFRIEG
jgi:glycerol-3-phosphate dehydrogenase